MFPAILASILPGIIERVVGGMISDPTVPIQSQAPTVAIEEARERVQEELRRVPELQHVTNTETHWWQKRSRLASILAVVTPIIAGVTGYNVSPEMQEIAVGGIVLVGNAISAFLAYRAGTATKPLGA